MKKAKKLILFTLIFSIMIILSNTSVVRANNETKEIKIEYNQQINGNMLEEIKSTRFKVLSTPKIKVEANPIQEDISKYYYNQLKHDISRNTYNTLSKEISNKVIVNLNNIEYSINETTNEKITNCFETNIMPYVIDGYEAYIMDSAEKYWWVADGMQFGEIMVDVGDGKVIFKTVEIISKVSEWSAYENFNTKLNEVCNSITGESVYEIVRSINYYICNNVEYIILDDTDIEQTAYGALMMNKAVCEGQAQLFNLMCRKKGVACLNIYGFTNENNVATAHAWNYVYEPTKKQWYAVDVTWNNYYKDPVYIMMGSETETNGTRFGKNHIAGFKQYVAQTYIPSSPTLATERYIDPITIDGEYIKNIQPDTMYKDLIKEFSSDTVFTITENNEPIADTDTIKTGQVLTSGNLSYILVVIGDTNGDGKANIQDIIKTNKHRLKKEQLIDDIFKAGDVNKDATINILDIMLLNKYRLSKISEL